MKPQQVQKTGGETEEEQIVAEAVIVPPDGGWGWVIVAASFLTNAVVDGIIFTAGQGFLPIWEGEFTKGSASRAAWAVSLLSGFYLLVGPIVSSVANIFGCRLTAMVGALVASMGFLLSMLAKNIWFLYISFGLFGGVGLGFIYLPSIVIVSYYFEKKRALATGMAVCGSGIGTFVFAPFIRFLLSVYNWQQTMMIISGVTLQCLIFAALYKKLTPSRQQVSKVNERLAEYEEVVKERIERKRTNTISNGRPLSYSAGTEKANEDSLLLAKNNVEFERFLGLDEDEQRATKRRAVSASERAFMSTMDLSMYRSQLGNTVHRHGSETGMRLGSGSAVVDASALRAAAKRSMQVLNRPLSRMDIFFAGSVQNLDEFKSQQDVRHFIASTLSIPHAVEEAAPDSCAAATEVHDSAKESVKATLRSLLDFSLLASPTFVIFALSGFLTLTGFFVPFIYLPKMAKESFGHDEDRATFLVSVLGITNIFGRILCGWLSDRPKANALMINNVALIMAGLATIVVPHCRPYPALCIYCVIFGTGTACFASLRSIICVELLGLEKLTNAFGLSLLFMGIASLIGSPLAGFLFDQTKTFNMSFYVMGVLVTLSGLIGLTLPYISRWEKRRNEKLSSDKKTDIFKAPSIVVYHAGESRTNVPETVREEEEDN